MSEMYKLFLRVRIIYTKYDVEKEKIKSDEIAAYISANGNLLSIKFLKYIICNLVLANWICTEKQFDKKRVDASTDVPRCCKEQ